MVRLSADDKDRASRKPIPKTIDGWTAEIEGVDKFIKASTALKSGNGPKWFRSMVKYYRSRLVVLANNPPPGLGKTKARDIVNEVLGKIPE